MPKTWLSRETSPHLTSRALSNRELSGQRIRNLAPPEASRFLHAPIGKMGCMQGCSAMGRSLRRLQATNRGSLRGFVRQT
jgi:hypothetical protein